MHAALLGLRGCARAETARGILYEGRAVLRSLQQPSSSGTCPPVTILLFPVARKTVVACRSFQLLILLQYCTNTGAWGPLSAPALAAWTHHITFAWLLLTRGRPCAAFSSMPTAVCCFSSSSSFPCIFIHNSVVLSADSLRTLLPILTCSWSCSRRRAISRSFRSKS
jgi:hypothetical protein